MKREIHFKERQQTSVKVSEQKSLALPYTHICSTAEGWCVLGQKPKFDFYSKSTEFYYKLDSSKVDIYTTVYKH